MASPADVRRNRLLGGLPSQVLERVGTELTLVDLPRGVVIHASGEPISWVHLPLEGLASLIGQDDRGSGVDVAVAGRDGVLGAQGALASMPMPIETVQLIGGRSARLPAASFRALMDREASLRQAVARYLAAAFVEIAQGSACNRLHDLRSRVARWLLLMADHAGLDDLALTHETLARMAGASRPKVSQAVAELVTAGCIETRRGSIRLADRSALEAHACGCYAIIRDARDRIESG